MSKTVRFSDFTADLDGKKLFKGAEEIRMEPKPRDVLFALLARAGQLVCEEELLALFWPEMPVVNAKGSLMTAIRRLRRALGPAGRLVETVYGEGYRFKAVTPYLPEEFREALRSLTWIAYEPVGYEQRLRRYPSAESIRRDLLTLRREDLDGLITFRAENTLSQIPRLAREVGFKGVVMGIAPDQPHAVAVAAANAPYVDSFCVGHNYEQPEKVFALLNEVRRETGKPVTTTWYLASLGDPRHQAVVEHCDWLLPDVGVLWRDTYVEPGVYMSALEEKVREAGRVAAQLGMAVMLKMVSYPSGGCEGYTPAAQRDFYSRVFRFYDSPEFPCPSSVSISFFSAFDICWKKVDDGYSACESHVGLFDSDRSAKTAISCFRERLKKYRALDH